MEQAFLQGLPDAASQEQLAQVTAEQQYAAELAEELQVPPSAALTVGLPSQLVWTISAAGCSAFRVELHSAALSHVPSQQLPASMVLLLPQSHSHSLHC